VYSTRNSESDATHLGVIIMPGGGYNELIDAKEQRPLAEYFTRKLGATAFVLYYRLVQADGTYRYPVPMWDAQRAIRSVRFNAARYHVDPDQLGIFGFSAGGHLASTVAIHSGTSFDLPSADSIDATDARPDFLGLGYPVISMDPAQYASPTSLAHLLSGYTGTQLAQLEQFLSGQNEVDASSPPTFLFESQDDTRISPLNSTLFVDALNAAGVPNEAHIFSDGVHGDGLARGSGAEQLWPQLFGRWLEKRGLLSATRAPAAS
jgi:acetyl esterase/lipase